MNQGHLTFSELAKKNGEMLQKRKIFYSIKHQQQENKKN